MKLDWRPWLLDPKRRDLLLLLLNKHEGFEAPNWVLKEMETLGLLESSPNGPERLSRKGWLLAYNIEEFRSQAESGKFFPLLEKMNISPGSIVLDIGCGAGQTLFALANRHPSLAVGIDLDPINLEIARSFALNFPLKKGSFAFQQGDGNFLPLKNGTVDFLICRGVLHYLDIHRALQEMARVLKPGGRLFIHAVALGFYIGEVLKCPFLEKLHNLFVIFNGTFFFLTGRQITLRYKKRLLREVFLPLRSLKIIERMGFRIKSLESFPKRIPAGYHLLVAEKF